ncbi:MAG: hypothetical protein DIZ80_14320 [endosymbiont of Galathealinum brachiosum]|uniref:Porin n=1 Tax=endosymbiont of Galathealinum brachiosum TaxID=2200906 RepID=A0A370DAF7_9GAMM|nr:MAG: hypothetical protein DIZ80_14320 [endosymbiont of Galathealinum brachiosum]
MKKNNFIKPVSKLKLPKTIFCFGFLFLNVNPLLLHANSAEINNHKIDQLEQQLKQQQLQINDLKNKNETSEEKISEEPSLELEGFFDVTAHSADNSDHPFDLGSFELDLQFDQNENISVSTALVWDGDAAEVAVAVLDYHANTHNVPTRGRLFGESGYHIQFGRFDIPFGIDYEFFAAPDRPNVTAPLTTQRIQNDGFNGDGIRAYGSISKIDYAVYWTNSLFEDEGNSIGTRIGFFPGRDPYSIHNRETQSDFIVGMSWLYDMDADEEKRNELQAVDITWRYGIVELILEYINLNSVDTVILPGGGSAGPADEQGYNSRVLIDFEPMAFFIGYGEWDPDYTSVLDADDPGVSYAVDKLNRVTIGGRYLIGDYVQIKLEYLSHLETATAEPDFEKRKLTFQMVASF